MKKKREIKIKALKASLAISLSINVVVLIVAKLGYRKHEKTLTPLTWQEFYETLPFATGIILLCIAISYWWYHRKYANQAMMRICPTCEQVFQHWEIEYGICTDCGDDVVLLDGYHEKQNNQVDHLLNRN